MGSKAKTRRLNLRSFLYSTLGVIIIGLGCGVVIEMAIGNGCCDCLYRSVYYLLCESFGDISYGIVNLGMNLIIFLAMLFVRPDLIGYGTIFNMVSIGYIVDIVQGVFAYFGVSGVQLPVYVRILAIAAILPIIAFGDALYFDADLGVSPYDAVAFMLEKLFRYKLSFRVVRTAGDIGFLVGGFLLGTLTGRQWELANVGTLILALFTGYFIDLFRRRVTGKLLA